jgi:hypothetical protein
MKWTARSVTHPLRRTYAIVVYGRIGRSCSAGFDRALHAQGPATSSIAPTTVELSATAHLRLPRSQATVSEQRGLVTDGYYARAGRRDGEILMIVGGAVILTGLLVDEGLITIAGAAIGGYGLYLYLRAAPKRRGTSS